MSTPDFTVERRVGRVIEARVRALPDMAAADRYFAAIRNAVTGVEAPQRAVICADHRSVPIYPPEVADRLIALFSSVNARIEAAGLLVARTNATVAMQIGRIVREARNPRRRVFHEAADLASFLGEVLDPTEESAMRSFLAAHDQ
jgi:hypothetical protein